MNILKQVFSVTNQYEHKVLTILGIKIKFKRKNENIKIALLEMLEVLEKDLNVCALHQKVFPKYQNINKGKTIVLCGAGPTLKQYKPLANAIHIALNRAFMYEKVKFDYLFVQDWKGIYNIINEIISYIGNNCIKFVGTQNGGEKEEIPQSVVNKFECERFITDIHRYAYKGYCKFEKDIATQPLGNFGTIAFPAMQFALWTNPEKIYLVGCDAAPVGHFDGVQLESNKNALTNGTYDRIVAQWKEFKKFADFYYPDVEIISINPVGLKGIFKDIYTNEKDLIDETV